MIEGVDFFSRHGITVRRTRQQKSSCSVALISKTGLILKLKIEGVGCDTDERLLGELLFYACCSTPNNIYCDQYVQGRALPTVGLATAQLGKRVREFMGRVATNNFAAAVQQALAGHQTPECAPMTDPPVLAPIVRARSSNWFPYGVLGALFAACMLLRAAVCMAPPYTVNRFSSTLAEQRWTDAPFLHEVS